MKNIKEPSTEAKQWVLRQIYGFVENGGGSFRVFCDEYLNIEYYDCYIAGGLVITDSFCFDPCELGNSDESVEW